MSNELLSVDTVASARGSELGPAVRTERIDGAVAVAEAITGLTDDVVVTPFQTTRWLQSWLQTIGAEHTERISMLVTREGRDGGLVMALPLLVVHRAGLRFAEPLDLGVSDYNAPLLGPAAPMCRIGAERLWNSMAGAMPACDLLRIDKMPLEIGGRINPLGLLEGAGQSRLFGSVLQSFSSPDQFLQARGRKFRKEFGRTWRRLGEEGHVRLRCVGDDDEAAHVLALLERHQAARMSEIAGEAYLLDRKPFAEHYRRLLRGGLADGSAQLFYLTVGDEPVAFLFGISHRGSFAVVRIAHAGERWSRFSLGRILIIEVMRSLAERQIREFDLTIGDYPFKRSFDPQYRQLADLWSPLTWRGRAAIIVRRARRLVEAGSAG